MKGLKFRQWCSRDKKFHYWGYLENTSEFFTTPLGYMSIDNPRESQQFTGLLDRLDKEIYELMEINNKYKVEYKTPQYILTNISNGEMLSLEEVIKNEYELTITKEYTEI